MKTESTALIVGGFIAISVLCFSYLIQKDEKMKSNFEQTVTKTNTNEKVHDWECKFCIEDSYNGDGKVMYHYIDGYTRNVDHSISFVGHDGLVWNIPYPYFYIHVNEHFKGTVQNVNPKAK